MYRFNRLILKYIVEYYKHIWRYKPEIFAYINLVKLRTI